MLNINNDVHQSVSPRTFEILATRTFQLMNGGQQSNGTLDFDRDLVQYEDVDDLIRKIDYYLQHDDAREQIAERGMKSVKYFSLNELMKNMLQYL
ncbi:MAG: glycosyltransferase [Selenomonas massiliensis]